MTTLRIALPATAWEPLPGGWILTDSDQAGHLVPTVPYIRNPFDCWAFIPVEYIGLAGDAACTRPHGHTGRHAVTVQNYSRRPGVRRVIAVWKETT